MNAQRLLRRNRSTISSAIGMLAGGTVYSLLLREAFGTYDTWIRISITSAVAGVTTLLSAYVVSGRLMNLLLPLLISLAGLTTAFADDMPLSVPARILIPAPPTTQVESLMASREPAPVATPAARMPQYQLHHKDLGDPGDPNSPQLRFILALPDQPLLIEASIFIEGQPFRQVRENRIQRIMRYIADSQASVVDNSGEPAVPAVPEYAAPANVLERIDRYTQSTGASPAVEEVRWLLTNWVDGPLLLFLNDNFQRFRANQQPVFKVLDRDRDGKISADELSQSVAAFQECDLNRDDIVEATELARAADDPRDQPSPNLTGRLIFRLPDEDSAAHFLRRLGTHYSAGEVTTPAIRRFDGDADGAVSPDELKQLLQRPADIRLRIEFSTSHPDSSRLMVDGISDEFAAVKESVKRNASSLTLSFPSFNLEFLAVQGSGSDQISIGAVNDGYAMLQEIDPDPDGRFSIRELRQLIQRLAAFDRNSDGQITSDETRPTFRVCIGLGPTAHQPLMLLREGNASMAVTPVAGPEWFTEMDKNKDRDLTRQEFPGTDEQFRQLDSDGDRLISTVEANPS